MRARFIAAALLLVSASTAFAGDQFHIFVSDVGYVESSTTGSSWSGSAGLGFTHVWNPKWSTEGSIAFDRRHALVTEFPFGSPVTQRENIDTYPVDLTMHFRFPNDSRWTPYLTGGVHYVAAPRNFFKPGTFDPVVGAQRIGTERYGNRTSGELGGGVLFRITPHVGLQFDVKRLLRTDKVLFDPLTRGSAGLSISF